MRFLGNIEAKTDAKGRAFLPANFRKILQVSGEESSCSEKTCSSRASSSIQSRYGTSSSTNCAAN